MFSILRPHPVTHTLPGPPTAVAEPAYYKIKETKDYCIRFTPQNVNAANVTLLSKCEDPNSFFFWCVSSTVLEIRSRA